MLDSLKKELDAFRKRVVAQSKKNLKNKKSTGNLANTIDSKLNFSKNSFELSFDLGSYGEFVDKGVRGADPSRVKNGKQKAPKSPFRFGSGTGKKGGLNRSLDKWIVRKGIAPRNAKGEFMSRQSLRFVLARSIYSQGIKPSLFFTKPFEKEFKNLSDDVLKAFGLDVDEFLKYTLNGK